MEKKVKIFKKVFLTVILIFSVLLLFFLFAPRQITLNLLSVKSAPITTKVDIYFIFSGGFRKNGIAGYSTKERISFLKKLLKLHPETPFVFLDYKNGKKLAGEILSDFNQLNLSEKEAFKYKESASGTVNNVLEMINFLKKHPTYRKVGIITSAYHEKRVKLLIEHYLKKEKLNNIEIVFFKDKNQEILNCSEKRYLSLIIHEIFGIMFFKIIFLFN